MQNEEVIDRLTIPNVLINLLPRTPGNLDDKVHFLSGDWGNVCSALKGETSFDFIVTSETIYNPENYAKLIQLFEECLSPRGEVYPFVSFEY